MARRQSMVTAQIKYRSINRLDLNEKQKIYRRKYEYYIDWERKTSSAFRRMMG